MCTHTHKHTRAHTTHIQCTYVHTYTFTHMCTHTYTHVRTHTCIRAHMYTHAYIPIHTHVHTHPCPIPQGCRPADTDPLLLDTATVFTVFSRTYILDLVILFLFSIYLTRSLSCFLSSTGCGFILLVFSSLMSPQYLRPCSSINIPESCQPPYQRHPTKASFGLVSLDSIWDFFPMDTLCCLVLGGLAVVTSCH